MNNERLSIVREKLLEEVHAEAQRRGGAKVKTIGLLTALPTTGYLFF